MATRQITECNVCNRVQGEDKKGWIQTSDYGPIMSRASAPVGSISPLPPGNNKDICSLECLNKEIGRWYSRETMKEVDVQGKSKAHVVEYGTGYTIDKESSKVRTVEYGDTLRHR